MLITFAPSSTASVIPLEILNQSPLTGIIENLIVPDRAFWTRSGAARAVICSRSGCSRNVGAVPVDVADSSAGEVLLTGHFAAQIRM